MSADGPPFEIRLAGASNLRDLGGWPAGDGRRVRRGLVFRAPALIGLTDEDADAVAALGLRTVCDFRGDGESEALPVLLPGARREHLPIEPMVGASLKDILKTALRSGHAGAAEMMDLLRQAYEAYALAAAPAFRVMFGLLADAENLPLLLHCSAGKDRTGFAAALLLTALGVGWDQVLDDYLATNRLWRREVARNFTLPAPVAEALLGAHAELLTAAFDALRGAYGSVDAYLDVEMGLNPGARQALADRLLEP